MKESDIQIRFKHYVEKNHPKESALYELKLTTNRFNVKQWVARQPHQLRSLLLASTKGHILYHKISDASYEQKPADCFVFTNAKAFLIIYYTKEHLAAKCEAKMVHRLLTDGFTSVTLPELRMKGAEIINL